MKCVVSGLAGLSLFCVGVSFAQPVQPPIEAYGSLPTVIDAELSPGGTRVALLMNTDAGPRLVIYEQGKGATKSADASAVRSNGVLFANDETVIIQASEAAKTWGIRGQYEYSAAITMNIETGKASQLLENERDLFPAQTGIGRIIGKQPSGRLLMPAFRGEKYAVPSYDLLSARLSNGRASLVSRGTRNTIDWFVDRGGNPLIREEYDNLRDSYELLLNESGRWRSILKFDAPELPISLVALANDASGIYYVGSQDSDGSFSALTKLNFDDTPASTSFSKQGADIDGVLTDINRHLVGVRYSGTFPDYDIVVPGLRRSLEDTQAVFSNARVEIDSWADDYSAVLYEVFDGFTVPFWILHDVSSGEYTLISYTHNDIPKEAIGAVYAISYPARDGLTIPAILTVPPGKDLSPGVKLPMIVMPHGGPANYDSFKFDWLAQFFANRGYLVLQPNFRGSTGYGQDFQDAGDGEWGGKMQDDITDGVNAMIKSEYADANRICIVGASYGGYAALAGGAFTPELYQCVAAIAPVTDLHDMLSEERRTRQRGHWAVEYWERLMAAGDASRDRLDAISPSEHAGNFQAPVLLVHGEADTVVDVDQSRIMERALERAGKPVKFVRLKNGDHWLRDSETRLATLQALDTFVSKHLSSASASSSQAPTPTP